MKMKITTLTAAVLLTASAGLAQETTTTTTTTTTTQDVHVWNDPNQWWANHWTHSTGSPYMDNELSLDLFANYMANQRKIEDLFKTNIRHGVWGGGVGLNYFFVKYLGIGGDIEMPAANLGNFVNNINGSLIARFPIACSGLAPYVFGGGGRQTNPEWQWTGHAGVGAEYRFNPGVGIFTDARYTWADKTSDTILFRAGFRFAF
ncbi:MAG TPA: hypothetical protein VKV04_08055 [Verrucomicrobiae bacterium]|nr:hypothetical protein [Verrucomicrobiae bacterium]